MLLPARITSWLCVVLKRHVWQNTHPPRSPPPRPAPPVGPSGASVRAICAATGADIRSFTESQGGRRVRVFVLEVGAGGWWREEAGAE